MGDIEKKIQSVSLLLSFGIYAGLTFCYLYLHAELRKIDESVEDFKMLLNSNVETWEDQEKYISDFKREILKEIMPRNKREAQKEEDKFLEVDLISLNETDISPKVNVGKENRGKNGNLLLYILFISNFVFLLSC